VGLGWRLGKPQGAAERQTIAFELEDGATARLHEDGVWPERFPRETEGVVVGFRSRSVGRVYTAVMGLARHRSNARGGGEVSTSTTPKLGPWGVYGEAIGNPKFYLGADPRDSEFLQAAEEFASAHEDVLRELAEH
jgi:hypothetical protein